MTHRAVVQAWNLGGNRWHFLLACGHEVERGHTGTRAPASAVCDVEGCRVVRRVNPDGLTRFATREWSGPAQRRKPNPRGLARFLPNS